MSYRRTDPSDTWQAQGMERPGVTVIGGRRIPAIMIGGALIALAVGRSTQNGAWTRVGLVLLCLAATYAGLAMFRAARHELRWLSTVDRRYNPEIDVPVGQFFSIAQLIFGLLVMVFSMGFALGLAVLDVPIEPSPPAAD